MLDYVGVVLDDQDGVAQVGEAVQDLEQFFNVVEVQAGGGFVENVERAAGLAAGKFLASLMRCASPPDSVVEDWPS